MRVLFLSKSNSVHTLRWVNALYQEGIDIYLFALEEVKIDGYEIPKDRIKTVEVSECKDCSTFLKLHYLKAIPALKEYIRSVKPDILHAHYASSYGLLASLTNFHPCIISVWGSDVYDFPRKSFLHRCILKYNLSKADVITSTSYTMAQEVSKYTKKEVIVIPFGVDTEVFKPQKVSSIFGEHEIVVGTVKALEDQYGVDILLKAFRILKSRMPNLPLKLLIVGGGSKEGELKKLAVELGIVEDVIFQGVVSHGEVYKYHNMLSVYVALSRQESFGVSVLESMACGKPVVVSSAGGLPEVVSDGECGFVVPVEDPVSAADAIEKLIKDQELREKFGRKGRERVLKFYNWKDNVRALIGLYEKTLNQKESLR